jgi:hypothetical protein
MIALFFSFVVFIVMLYGAFLLLCIFLGILRGLPSIGRGLAARWSDDPCNEVRGLPPRLITPVKALFLVGIALLALVIFGQMFAPRPYVDTALQAGFDQSRASALEQRNWYKNH